MKTSRIGTTDVRVTKVSFGCSSIGNLFREVSGLEAKAVLEAAWTAGIRYFDTAPHYGRGLAEARLGEFLRGRDGAVVSTKVGRVLSPAAAPIAEADGFVAPAQNDVRYDYSGDGIEECIEQSLERLGRRALDIVYVHDIGTYTHGADNDRHMKDFLGSGYERLAALKARGRVGAIGLGVNECQVCLDVMDHCAIDAILLAGRLTLLDRSAEAELVPRCRAAGVSLVLGGVLNSGILATGPVEGAHYDYGPAPQEILDRVAILQDEAGAEGLTLVQAAMRFVRDHPAAASVLVGTAMPSMLEANVRLLSGRP